MLWSKPIKLMTWVRIGKLGDPLGKFDLTRSRFSFALRPLGSGRGAPLFGVFFLVVGLWALATPLFGVPDEQDHMVRATGTAFGDLNGELKAEEPYPFFEVSTSMLDGVCFAFEPDVSADCLPLENDSGSKMQASRAASYPPLAHLLYSIGPRLSDGLVSFYGMRFMSVVLVAFLLTWSSTQLIAAGVRGSLLVPILLCVMTPMSLALFGSVNPSGQSIGFAAAAWSGVIRTNREAIEQLSSRHALYMGLPFLGFMLIRRDALVWGAAIALCFTILLAGKRLRIMLKYKSTWVLLFLIALVASLQFFVWGGVGGGGLDGVALGSSEDMAWRIRAAFGDFPRYLNEAVGVLGWLDTWLPGGVYLVWASLFVSIVLFGVSFGRPRISVTLGVGVVLLVAIPSLVGAMDYPYFQGRYMLPLVLGLVLLSGAEITDRVPTESQVRPAIVLSVILVILHFVSFAQSLRRFSVGISQPWSKLFSPNWEPPVLGVRLILVLYLFSLFGLCLVLSRSLGEDQKVVSQNSQGAPN